MATPTRSRPNGEIRPSAAMGRVLLACVLGWLGSFGVKPAEARDPGGIQRFERLHDVRFEPDPLSPDDRSAPTGSQAKPRTDRPEPPRGTLRFDALGRRFAVALQSNQEIVVDLPDAVRSELSGIDLYKGPIEGRAGSWSRLVRIGDQWTGLLYDGEELLAVEPELGIGSANPSEPIFYRVADVEATGTCAMAGAGSTGLDDLALELKDLAAAAAKASLFVDVAVIGDERFTRNQDDPLAMTVALFNAVDGLYSRQVGVSLNVVDIDLLDDDGGLASSQAGQLLDELAALAGSPVLDNPGLVHLLTGRNLDGSTVGVAFIGTLCSEAVGVGLSQIRNGSFALDTILVAHEIGHNFGAPHDGELGSACAATPPGFVMSANLGDTSDRFSTCSIDSMEPEIASARCLGELPPDEPEVSAPCLFDADFALNAQGFGFVADAQTPKFTAGSVTGSGLVVDVGGVTRKNKKKMVGFWELACHSDAPTSARFTLDANLIHSARYDDGENSKLRLRVNGEKSVLARIKGADDDGAVDLTTGSRTYVVDTFLPAGTSTIRLDCLNNKKTGRAEVTRCEFERLTVTGR